MKYRSIILKIQQIAEDYEKAVKSICRQMDQRKLEYETKLRSITSSGTFTEKGVEQWKEANKIKTDDLTAALLQYRKEAKEEVEKLVEKLDIRIENYFNAPISQDFANKIQTINLSGLTLSNAEFDMLVKNAKTYIERRILANMAENRVKEAIETRLEGDSFPEPANKKVLKNDSYTRLRMEDLPNMDSILHQWKEYKQELERLFNSYYGDKAQMYYYCTGKNEEQEKDNPHGYDIGSVISTTANSFIQNNHTDKLLNIFEQSNLTEEDRANNRNLTESEKVLIDEVIDPNYPSLAAEKVKSICAASPYFAELLELDERYVAYVPEV